MNFAQCFCSVNDLVEDQQSAGANEARWFQSIREASDYLQKEIGWFLPVLQTRTFNGGDKKRLWVPPLLSISSIYNSDTLLSAADYRFSSDGPFWANGPYTFIDVDDDAANLSSWYAEDDGVSVTGQWGLYSRKVSSGVTVASDQNNSSESLVVSDGGKVSPGMVLEIGSEQELVNGWGSATNNVTTCATAVAVSDQVLSVADGTKVKIGEIIRIDFEQMKVRDIRTNSVSVIRGWNGTGISAHVISSQVDVYRTVSVERAVNGTTAAAHSSAAAISRYVAPDDIQFLTRQIAVLMVNKAKGGYQGKSGNAETGAVFYTDAFPRFDIERVKKNYMLP